MKTLIFLSFASLTLNIYAQRGMGLIFKDEEYKKVELLENPLGFGDNLPVKYSLKQYAPFICDQGNTGTCVGWSSTYYVATMEYAILLDIQDPFEIKSNAFDPYYTYLSIRSNNDYDCDWGTFLNDACEHLVKNGVKRYGYETYECGSEIRENVQERNSLIDFVSYRRLIDKEELSKKENIEAIKQAIVDKHPVLMAMNLPKSFHQIGTDGILRTSDEIEATIGGHAMTIIGYDDNLNGGSFIIPNSWGTNWGDDGYCYVTYDDFYQYGKYAFAFESELKQMGSSGCVFGDCENGYGRYITSSSDVYEGNFMNGQYAGYGMYFWESNSYFQGEWEEDNRHGKGKYYKDPYYSLSGFWKNGTHVGNEYVENRVIRGTFYKFNVEDYLLGVSHDQAFNIVSDADFLDKLEALEDEGCLFGDCVNGMGLMKYNNGLYYGHFESGERDGIGAYYWLNSYRGHKYHGSWANGSRTGTGKYTFPNGTIYIGEMLNGEFHGKGARFYTDGTSVSGTWTNDVFDGESLGFGGSEEVPIKDSEKESVEDATTRK